MKKGLTFRTLLGFDDIQKEFDLVFNEHRELIKLIMGDNYGIVSSTDVSKQSPLFPTLDNNVLSVTEGRIVTKNGDTTKVDAFSKEINSISEDLAILFVFEMIGSNEKRVTNDGNASSVWFDRKSTDESILIIKASNYNLLSDEVKNNSVCICIIKYDLTTPYVDLTNSEYSFNRPWFSPTDISHRLEKGSGDSSVPHSIGINDLASSNVTLYNQLLSRGIIVSKDVSISGVSGKSRKQIVKIEDDSSNKIKLDVYPNAIGYCSKNEDGEGFGDVSAFLIEGSNNILIPNIDELKDGETSLYIDTVITPCLMPPILDDYTTNELQFGSNEDNDILITEGKQTELLDNTISFSNCGTVEKTYEVVFSADGKLHKEPSILGYTSLLSSIVDTTKVYNQEFSIPVKINVVLENLTSLSNGEYIKIKINGITDSGTEDFSELEWNSEETIDTTDKYFKKITSIEAEKEGSISSTCKATIFAITNSALDNRLKVALVEWSKPFGSNTFCITKIKDIRPISTTIRDPFDLSVIKETGKAIVNSNFINSLYNDESKSELILIEDFRKVSYLSSQSVNWKITPYGINYQIIKNNIFDSRNITSCYRSRRIYEKENNYKYAVILIDSDYETNHNNSVRIGTYDVDDNYNEFTMFPAIDDNGNIVEGMFILYINSVNIKDIQIIVSGKAAGFVLLRLSQTKPNEYYEV